MVIGTQKQSDIDRVIAWAKANPDKVKAAKRRWHLSHMTQERESKRRSSQKNRETLLIGRRAREKRKRASDPEFAALVLLRSRLRVALKGTRKIETTIGLLGCSLPALRRHIESKFKPGMSWENRGRHGWHLDHIKPCSTFDLCVPEQQRECFHYSNLQPLWWRDNLQKGNKCESIGRQNSVTSNTRQK